MNTIAPAAMTRENPSSPPDANLTADDVVSAAKNLVPLLREHAVRTDEERRIPDEVYRAVQEAGLLHILKPKKYHGLELSEHEHARVVMELAKGCASTAWVVSILSSDNMAILSYPEQTQDEIWADDSYATLAGNTNLNPKAKTERVSGGYRLSGSWGFCSGSDFSEWLIFNAPVGEDGEGHMFLLPREDVGTVDDWTPTGLRGTGSRTKVVDDVFVPDHRIMKTSETVDKLQERRSLHPTFDALYAPWPSYGRFSFAGVGLGAALGASDQFAATAGSSSRVANALGGRVRLADQDYIATEFADIMGELEMAQRQVEYRSRVAAEQAAQHISPSEKDLAIQIRDNSLVARVALEATQRLQMIVGAKAGFPAHYASRAKRDAEMVASHVTLNWRQASVRYLSAAIEEGSA
ncbi:acyl-CoA dehydrogenase family protein [Microbacterium sp. SORGH_AS_0888]|uniref:acyl-CoA dehydrogenase family protein n=1 Tax=Microbacterium sp. SORGH_AS_0888 TaxID=3041791 RepID=UPI00278A1BDA|nr:acyl-CoA dehydrogenase family protein [Microbacterium sp. SORGH_AS_0888]MDQ1130879.1 alkylation response protein AidB-like acyl-CoA dehydrogenase [Microbacterium sp. SORGH_AS_0888]